MNNLCEKLGKLLRKPLKNGFHVLLLKLHRGWGDKSSFKALLRSLDLMPALGSPTWPFGFCSKGWWSSKGLIAEAILCSVLSSHHGWAVDKGLPYFTMFLILPDSTLDHQAQHWPSNQRSREPKMSSKKSSWKTNRTQSAGAGSGGHGDTQK